MLADELLQSSQEGDPRFGPFHVLSLIGLVLEVDQYFIGVELGRITHFLDVGSGSGRDSDPAQSGYALGNGGQVIELFVLTVLLTYVLCEERMIGNVSSNLLSLYLNASQQIRSGLQQLHQVAVIAGLGRLRCVLDESTLRLERTVDNVRLLTDKAPDGIAQLHEWTQ